MLYTLLSNKNGSFSEYVYIIIFAFIIVLTMAIMTIISSKNIALSKLQRFRISGVFITIAIISLADMGSSLIELSKSINLRWLGYTLTFWTLCSVPYIPIALATIIRGGELMKNKPCLIAFILFHIYVLTLLILTICGYSFTITDEMEYVKHNVGTVFYIISYACSVLFLLIDSFLQFKNLLAKRRLAIFILFLILIVSTTLQLSFGNVRFTYLIISIITIIFYDYYSSIMSQVDGLTGLFSQYSLIKYIHSVKKNETIFVMDADDFKAINDTYGHIKGDTILIELANIIQSVFGKVGKVFRNGGDEFVAIVKKDVDSEKLIQSFRIRLAESKLNESMIPYVSIGYAKCDGDLDGEDYEKIADENMYIDKARHKAKQMKIKLNKEDPHVRNS